MNQTNYNIEWSKNIANTLYEEGVRDICISPGHRNTPLVIAMVKHPGLNCTSHVDERSASFFALGMSKKNNYPSVIITTSGTATANLYPAVIEANLNQIPLIVLTADRPKNLVGTGENQTIEQSDLYGYHVRNFQSLDLPSNNNITLQSIIRRTFRISMGLNHNLTRINPPGPTHLNVPFEEPLFNLNDFNIKYSCKIQVNKKKINYPKINFHKKYNFIKTAKNIIIVCGRINNFYHNVLSLSKKINAPIFADPLSQLRYNIKHKNILTNYDHFLADETLVPDLIIRIGKKPVSKNLNIFLNQWDNCTIFLSPNGRFNDNSSNLMSGDINYMINLLIEKIDKPNDDNWLKSIIKMDKISGVEINEKVNSSNFDSSKIVNQCIKSLKDNDVFFVGNSLPIRSLDYFTKNTDKKITVLGNRGASGIDGIVSTAMGVASKNKNNTLLLIGDLSFYHDMNGLIIANRYEINITIIVENNNGGGIFKKLNLDENNENFEEFWKTPINLKISKIADLYNYNYFEANNSEELMLYLDQSIEGQGKNIIEARVI